MSRLPGPLVDRLLKAFFKKCFASSVFDSTLVLHVQKGNEHAERLKSTKCSSVTVLY